MDKIEIIGGSPIFGTVRISGSKNSTLPILACSLLTNDIMELTNVPRLSDIHSMIKLLGSLNTEISFKNSRVTVQSSRPQRNFASYDLVRKMRASFLVLGPLLAKYGNAKVSLPGGCAIGARPIDMHLDGFEKMGAKFLVEDGYVIGEVKKKLKGAKITLPFQSVGATENLLMAACLADGQTLISNAAQEPEIIDLGKCLILMGASIEGLGSKRIKIIGKKNLSGCKYRIMSDRIEAGTYALAVLGCSGKLEITNLDESLIDNFIKIFSSFDNFIVKKVDNKTMVVISNKLSYKGIKIKTAPFPEFPTDLQAQLSAVMTKAYGESIIEETIFENRFMHVAELIRMGAEMHIDGAKVIIQGKEKIFGAQLMATDLRASSSLIIAGLMAEGKTIINRVYHLDRGYENIEKKLSDCNVKIRRIKS